MSDERFDARYYERYYLDRRTRVAEPAYYERLAAFIAAYNAFVDVRVRTILDLGCGIGVMRKPLLQRYPKARYVGVDISPYACAKFGFIESSILDYEGAGADLVICHDVVQYLSRRDAKEALSRFAALCTGTLYFSVLTREDWDDNCDQSRTDGEVYMRSTSWYRRHLKPNFRNLGGGLYLSRTNNVTLYSLEHLD